MFSFKSVWLWLLLLSAVLALAQGTPEADQQRLLSDNARPIFSENHSLAGHRTSLRPKRALCTGKFSKLLIQPCYFHCQTFGMNGKCSADRKCNCVPY